MPVDSLTLAAALVEARPVLVGSRLQVIAQTERNTLSLAGRSGGQPWHWYVDLRDGVARAHLSSAPVGKGLTPPWLQQCRKHVEGGRILAVEQEPWERVLHLRLAGRDALGDPRRYRLTVEIMGRYSLALLVDEATGQIVTASRTVDETMSRWRQIAPGLPYALPPKPAKPTLAECSDDVLHTLVAAAEPPWPAWIAKHLAGLGRDRVATLGADLPDDLAAARSTLIERLIAWREAWRREAWHWVADGEPRAWPGEGQLAGLNEALDRYYRERLAAEALERERRQLITALTQAHEQANRQLADWDAALADRAQAERLQQEAELLQANLYRIAAGAAAVTVEDYFDPAYPSLTLELDPHRTPAENVQDRFRQAQKQARRLAHAEAQRDTVAATVAALDEAAYYAGVTDRLDELRGMAEDLQRQGLLKTTKHQRVTEVTGPDRYRSNDGLEILVGRSSRQNETILHEIARGHDMWLHAQYMPGAHVLVRLPKGTQLPDRTLTEAANLAAYFSKARHAAHVPIVVVPRRFVRSPKGAPAGFVHYSNETVVVGSPDPAGLPKLIDGNS